MTKNSIPTNVATAAAAAAEYQLPLEEFKVDLYPGSITKVMDEKLYPAVGDDGEPVKKNGETVFVKRGRKLDNWHVRVEELRLLPGFNPRVRTGPRGAKRDAEIRRYADSMKAEGFFPHCPLEVFVANVDGKDVIYVIGGHGRLEAP